jgi:hypothetical protein
MWLHQVPRFFLIKAGGGQAWTNALKQVRKTTLWMETYFLTVIFCPSLYQLVSFQENVSVIAWFVSGQ